MQFISFNHRPNVFKDDVEEVFMSMDNFSHIYNDEGRVKLVSKTVGVYEIVCMENGEPYYPTYHEVVDRLLVQLNRSVISLIHI